MFDRRFVRILTSNFRTVSRSTIGRVRSMWHSQGTGLEIGNKRAFFHDDGVKPVDKQALKRMRICFFNKGPICFSSSYVMVVGPAALLLGREERTSSSSDNSMGIRKVS